MRLLSAAGMAAVGILLLVTSVSASSPGDQKVLDRQAIFKQMEKVTKKLKELLGQDLQAQHAAAADQTLLLKRLSRQPWEDFSKDTANTSAENRALPSIWNDPEGWKAAQNKFISAASELDAVAAHGTPDEIRQRAAALGAACRDCHKAYKSR